MVIYVNCTGKYLNGHKKLIWLFSRHYFNMGYNIKNFVLNFQILVINRRFLWISNYKVRFIVIYKKNLIVYKYKAQKVKIFKLFHY